MKTLSVLAGLLLAASPGFAQHAPVRFAQAQDSVRVSRDGWDAIRVVKWSTALTSAGVVAYGFVQNREADREYEEIELLCQTGENVCLTKPGSSEYADPALEARYNDVLQRDERAQVALIAGQVGLAASVLLFILDLPEGTITDDIPYDPRSIRVGFEADRVRLGVHVPAR